MGKQEKATGTGDWKAPSNCLTCSGTSATIVIVPKFSKFECGHAMCQRCGISFDSNVNSFINMKVTREDVQNIRSEAEYHKMFVEDSTIANAGGKIYDKFHWDDNEGMQQGIAKHVVEAVRRNAPDLKVSTVLDLGCANGFSSVVLSKAFSDSQVVAVDPSPTVNGVSGINGIRAIQGTLDSLVFEGEQFDLVSIIGNVFLHLNPHATLKEAVRVLKPGGLLVVDFKNVNSTVRRFVKVVARLKVLNFLPAALVDRAFVNMRYGFTRAYMRKIFSELGMQELECYSKPPRLLEFKNSYDLQQGIKGALWRTTNSLDGILDEKAWVQFVLRKPVS